MRDLIKKMQKVLNVNSRIYAILTSTIIVLFYSCATSQTVDKSLTSLEYEIINDFFSSPNGISAVTINHKTYEDKDWASLFNHENITELSGNPSYVSDEEIMKILNDKVLDSIKSKILLSKPVRLENDRLNNVKLSNSVDYSISAPIIINDIAIFRKKSDLEVPIYILKFNNGNWEIIYTFYEKLILE